MNSWNKVKKGGIACVIAPSYGFRASEDAAYEIRAMEDMVRSYNLIPHLYKDSLVPGNHSLFDGEDLPLANSDEVRSEQLISALTNPICDIVWCLRGGYGAIRLLKHIETSWVPDEVKPFVGFSDATILHSFLNNAWGWPTIHFGMPSVLQEAMNNPQTKQTFQDMIFGTVTQVSFKLNKISAVISHDISGITSGGNMFNFEKLLGTKYSIPLQCKILVLEDIGEPARKLDGLLEKLQLIQGYEQLSAVIFGEFAASDVLLFGRVIKSFADSIPIPVFTLFDENTIGHGKINSPLPLGTEATIHCYAAYCELVAATGMTEQAVTHEDL